MAPIRVLVVDDSAMVRMALERGLGADPGIEVVGSAEDPYQARDLLVHLKPQVMTLDVEMPKMDGVTFLRKLMPQWPIPVVMVSSLTERGAAVTLQALEAGAVDFVAKPTTGFAGGLEAMLVDLREKVKMAATVDVSRFARRHTAPARHQAGTLSAGTRAAVQAAPQPRLIVIGASTGGTEALRTVLTALPAAMPPIAVVQHMPANFTKLFAERMDQLCELDVREAVDGDSLRPGLVLIAPGGHQMRLVKEGGRIKTRVRHEELVNGHQPSCDPLFRSAIPWASDCIGVILTGMGADGAEALLALHQAGARTIGQDAASCVVYGMPKVAFERGAVQKQMPLDRIGPMLAAMAAGARA